VTQRTEQASRRLRRTAILATSAALARRHVILRRRHQESMASARRICHTARVNQARRRAAAERRRGRDPGMPAWFAVEGVIADQPVRAVWSDGQLHCDRLLEARARVLVDLGAEFGADDVQRRYRASLQAPPAAVLLTVIRACDLAMVIEVDLGDHA
jgi:hypothetical protein